MSTEKARELRDKDTLIGSLLDAWQGTPNDLKDEMREFGCGRHLDALESFMEDPETNPPPTHIARALAQPVVDEAMVERVARAMFDRHASDPTEAVYPDAEHREFAWQQLREAYIKDARAALTAAGMGSQDGRG